MRFLRPRRTKGAKWRSVRARAAPIPPLGRHPPDSGSGARGHRRPTCLPRRRCSPTAAPGLSAPLPGLHGIEAGAFRSARGPAEHQWRCFPHRQRGWRAPAPGLSAPRPRLRSIADDAFCLAHKASNLAGSFALPGGRRFLPKHRRFPTSIPAAGRCQEGCRRTSVSAPATSGRRH